MRGLLLSLLLLIGMSTEALAHVGSPDVYYEGDAGPYKLFVTVRPPEAIPGVADLQIRAEVNDIKQLRIVPLPLTGEGARFAPVPDVATPLPEDPQTFSGHLWMMTAGAWQVRILAEGARGPGEMSVPVPTLPQRTRGMQAALVALLVVLLAVLLLGLISIAGAAAGEAKLEPGQNPTAEMTKQARRVMAVTALFLLLAVIGGARWWQVEAARYDEYIYRPLSLNASVVGGELHLTMSAAHRRGLLLDDLAPDHDHLMHLFMLRMPAMEQVWHLHPTESAPGSFVQNLPMLAAGSYKLYADIVHQTGVPETLTAELTLPAAVTGRPLSPSGDDAAGAGPPIAAADPARNVSPLSGGAQMVFLREPGPLKARAPHFFRFRVEDSPGHPAEDLELYMGMLGHAAFVKHDGSVFAHVHPSGSVPMAMLALTSAPHPHHHSMSALPSEVSFPYGFPQPGDYRIFVQVKRKGAIETGIFDAHVE